MKSAATLVALVIEDDDFQRRTIARMLRTLGAEEVREARNGKQALLEFANGTVVDLAVCDLGMPEMDGMELLRLLGQTKSMVSVIILSAQNHSVLSSVEKMARAYGVHLLGVIEKPATLNELQDLIALHPIAPCTVATTPHFSLDEIIRGVQDGQFLPYFQPKVALATGRILGAEALARWQHPELGLINPDAFIAPLEQTGDIFALTMLMLEKAATACSEWRRRDLDMTVSVNLSLNSLNDTGLADKITRVVSDAGLDPHHLILEITETAAMTNVAPALENFARLRMRGFGLSIDDYGTGFSSLQQLTRVPFTELKIDQSFVKDCAVDPSSHTIVISSVEMARQLGITSVAEGVESQREWDLLKASGCETAQGYHIGKPMSQSAFLAFCAPGVVHDFQVPDQGQPLVMDAGAMEHNW